MTLFRGLVTAAAVAGAFAAGSWAQKTGVLNTSKSEYLKLSEPLLLSAEGEARDFHILPAGTPLYRDQSFAEGHTRYIVYLNIKGEFRSEKISSDKPGLIDPIWASPLPTRPPGRCTNVAIHRPDIDPPDPGS